MKWAKEQKDRYIIEDDYDSEFRYSGKPVPALQGLDTGENVIYMGTFSKLLLPSLRISYMVLPISLINIYQEDFFFYAQTVSRIDQNILKEFLNRGHWEKHIQKMKVVYRKKRDVLITAISKHFPESVEVIGEDSGLHLTLRLNNGMTEQEAIDQAAKFGVKVNSVSEYGENDGQTVLLGFAVLSIEQIKAAVKLLEKVIIIKIFFSIMTLKVSIIQSIVYKNDAKRDFCYSYCDINNSFDSKVSIYTNIPLFLILILL